MTRTLSTLADTHRQRMDVGWARLAKLVLWRDKYAESPSSLTLYLSDRTRYVPVAGGGTREYLGCVLTWGTTGDSLEALNPATSPASVDLVLSNQFAIAAGGSVAARFTDLIREGSNTTGYDTGGADLTVGWLPPGGTVGTDDVTLYVGHVATIDPTDEPTVTLRSTSVEGEATIPVTDAAVGPGSGCADCPAWLSGKAFAREIHYDGDIVAGVPDFGDVDEGSSWEIDAAYVESMGVEPPIFRNGETLQWSDLRSGGNPNRYAGYYYIYARDPAGPFTGSNLPWFNDGTINKIRNVSSVSVAGGTNLGLTGDIEVLELEDIATQEEFDALTPSNPPTVKRVIATITPTTTADGWTGSVTPVQYGDAPSVDVTCVTFLALRMAQWLTEFDGDSFPGPPEILSNLVMNYRIEIS